MTIGSRRSGVVFSNMYGDALMRKLDAVFLEQFLNLGIDCFSRHEFFARFGRQLDPDDHRRLFHLEDTLRFVRLDEHMSYPGVSHQRLAEILDQLAGLIDRTKSPTTEE